MWTTPGQNPGQGSGPRRRRAWFERVVASGAPPWPLARPSKCSHALCAWRMVETRPSATHGAAEGTSRVDPGVHRGDAAALLEGAAPPARHVVMRCACCRVRQQSLVDVPSVTRLCGQRRRCPCIEHATPCHGHRRRASAGEASGLCSLSTLGMSARGCLFDTSGRSTYGTVQTTLVTTHTGRSGAIWVLQTLSRPGHGFSHKVPNTVHIQYEHSIQGILW